MTVGRIEYVTDSLVYPELVMVSRIFPVPDAEKPERFGELAVAVQLNTAKGTVEDSRMLVVCPEQSVGVMEFICTSGRGFTVTTIFWVVPLHPLRVGKT